MLDEPKLIRQCLANDSAALSQLYKQFSPVLFAICLRYASNREEAQDLLHDGYIRILNSLADFRFEGSFEGWMKRIMVNMAINYYRKRAKINFAPLEHTALPGDDAPSAIDSLNAEQLILLIAGLPDGYRQVFNLYALEGFKHREIAEMLGISENTSKSQYMKARKWLIHKLVALDPDSVNMYSRMIEDES
jgi:RNA polymerase sigma factor (sigma-70 family)